MPLVMENQGIYKELKLSIEWPPFECKKDANFTFVKWIDIKKKKGAEILIYYFFNLLPDMKTPTRQLMRQFM
jgi:hypothetical protein